MWSRACYNFLTQLLVRFQVLKQGPSLEDGTVPHYWSSEHLPKIDKCQCTHWDETHKKCTIGGIGAGSVQYHIKFPRDANGKLDLKNGSYTTTERTELNVKYEKEVRLCCGSGIRMEGTQYKGYCLKPFVYSGITLLSIPDYNRKIQQELKHVKNLKYQSTFWCVSRWTSGMYYKNDTLL